MVAALLKQLVWEAGVDPCCITICDSSRYIANKIFDRCYALFPEVHYNVTNFYDPSYHWKDDRLTDPRRPPVQPSPEPLIHYSGLNPDGSPIPSNYVPMPFVDANYVISLAIMKCHGQAGVTLTGKNWYGSCCVTPGDTKHNFLNKAAQSPQYNHYRLMVDLMGYENLGGKTMLFILDGLFGFPAETGAASKPVRWNFFNNDFPSSIFMSQDHVAIDSVALDFLLAEFSNSTIITSKGAIDDYLHEAALANDPCSGTFYDPEADGAGLQSLGTHEHWNNPNNKQYTRNLGTGAGIELVSSPTTNCLGPLDGDIDGDYQVDYSDLYRIAAQWPGGDDPNSDLDGSGVVDFNDFAILADNWRKCNVMPQIFQAGFEDCNLVGWQATDANAWRIEDANGGRPGKALSLFTQSVYTPPYTSPRNINLIPDVNVGSFVMELQMLSTKPYYAGRDLIVFFGYQDPAHFYYAHIADVADNVHNRIHIVNGAPRAPIDETRNSGNSWEGGWHTVRLVRNIDSGKIEVYFDDMNTPVMTATNTRFLQGKVGVGSFDDVGQFDNIRLWGK